MKKSKNFKKIACGLIVILLSCSSLLFGQQGSSASKSFIIEFDESKINADYFDMSKRKFVTISNGSKIKAGVRAFFTPKHLKRGKVVKVWKINDSISEFEQINPNECVIVLSDKYANNKNKIKINYTVKKAKKYTLKFSNDIEFQSFLDYNESTFNKAFADGDEITEGHFFDFKLKDGVKNKAWFVGDKKMWHKGRRCGFCVSDIYAKDGIIEISNK